MPWSPSIPEMLSHLPKTPGVSDELIADTQQLIGYELPADLLDFYRACNGADNTAYATTLEGTPHIRLDRMEDWVANSDNYDFAGRKLIMIGADGGAFAYCLSLKTLPMQYRQIDFGDTGQGQYMGSSFAEFLVAVRNELKLKAPKTTEKPKPLPPPAKDKPLRELKGFPYPVLAMNLAPSGEQVIGASAGNTVLLLDLQTGKPLPLAAVDETDYVRPLVGWVNGRPVFYKHNNDPDRPGVTHCYRGRLVDGHSGEELSRWYYQGDFHDCREGGFSPDGTRFCYVGQSTQFLGETVSGRTVAELPRPGTNGASLAWSPDSAYLALGRNGDLHRADSSTCTNPEWQVLIVDRDGMELAQIPVDNPKEPPCVRCVRFNATGERLLLTTDKSVRIHAMKGAIPSPQAIAEFRVPMRHLHAACFVGADRLAVTTAEGQIVLFALDDPKPIRIWQSTKLQARLLLATPDGKLLLTANGDEPYAPEAAVSKTIRVLKVDV